MGRQVQAAQQTCGGLPGLIYKRGQEVVADPAKTSEVASKGTILNWRPNGDLQKVKLGVWVRRAAAPQSLRDQFPGKWIRVEPHHVQLFPPEQCRYLSRAVGPVIAGAHSMVIGATPRNRLNAVFLRVFRELGFSAEPGVWRHMLRFAPLLSPRLFAGDFSELAVPAWLQDMPTERKPALLRAAAMYAEVGWTPKFELFSSFIKVENQVDFGKDNYGLCALDYCAPRLIQGPHDVGHIIMGPKLKPMLKLLKEEWSFQSPLFYASATPRSLQAWLNLATSRFPTGLVFWSDYSMYDSSYTADHWEFVESFYRPFINHPGVRQVLHAWRMPRGKCGDFKYQGPVMNASGRDDTAFANGLLNGYAFSVASAASWYKKSIWDITPNELHGFLSLAMLSVCGDDALGVLPWVNMKRRAEFTSDLKKNIAALGFKAKAFASDRWQDAVYLGHRPVVVDGVWYWSRTLGRCLYKLGWQSEIKGDPLAWMTGVMDMHLRCSKHVPVLADIADAWCSGRKGCKKTPVRLDPNRPWEWMTADVAPDHYAEDTLAMLAEAYSVRRDPTRGDLVPCDTKVTVADFRECIDYCRSAMSAGRTCVLDHWLLRHMVWVDEQ